MKYYIVKRICLRWRRLRFDPWVRKMPWRREWLPTPVFLPGEFHGQRSLIGYIIHGVARSRTQLSNEHTYTPSANNFSPKVSTWFSSKRNSFFYFLIRNTLPSCWVAVELSFTTKNLSNWFSTLHSQPPLKRLAHNFIFPDPFQCLQ